LSASDSHSAVAASALAVVDLCLEPVSIVESFCAGWASFLAVRARCSAGNRYSTSSPLVAAHPRGPTTRPRPRLSSSSGRIGLFRWGLPSPSDLAEWRGALPAMVDHASKFRARPAIGLLRRAARTVTLCSVHRDHPPDHQCLVPSLSDCGTNSQTPPATKKKKMAVSREWEDSPTRVWGVP